ncbi:MAG: CRISPR-associated endoribonuclease Cas6 [Oscillatoria sp. PMC 1051.18]|nr:CRISPR-associated endoribonuclease Cas6 [Oscillatoria sp. PMC 1050.18]MEC5029873.1 CRISPR-associated endoribonuclease Cas6 [Oscillatoria sp. PMC 1051.18]
MAQTKTSLTNLTWSEQTELVGLVLSVVPQTNATLFPQYTIGLHAWFLDQVRQLNPQLSQYLHDGQSEKPFTISDLEGEINTQGKQLQLKSKQTYRWYVNALSVELVEWLKKWLEKVPATIDLRSAPLEIIQVAIANPPTTYKQLLSSKTLKSLNLSFISPTSFRRKKHHFPLPLPRNVFHSYLRRWNDFSNLPYPQDEFLDWIDEYVLINRHQLQTTKVAAGKRGTVTGFVGAIEYSLAKAAFEQPEFVDLFSALGQLAPYCGTGHKTTFGLGRTKLSWTENTPSIESLAVETQLAQRIEELTTNLLKTQKRTGGTRALNVCQTRATILARQERGESLKNIALELDMSYETVKTYAKIARKALNS